MHEYRMIPMPNAFVARFGTSINKQAALGAEAFTEFANEQASQGWEFYRVDTFTIYDKGCLGGLFGGGTISSSEYYVATFRRPK